MRSIGWLAKSFHGAANPPRRTRTEVSLFYRNQNGADTGNLFMSLIHTCEFCEANPFDYLNELQRHAKELAANPAD